MRVSRQPPSLDIHGAAVIPYWSTWPPGLIAVIESATWSACRHVIVCPQVLPVIRHWCLECVAYASQTRMSKSEARCLSKERRSRPRDKYTVYAAHGIGARNPQQVLNQHGCPDSSRSVPAQFPHSSRTVPATVPARESLCNIKIRMRTSRCPLGKV